MTSSIAPSAIRALAAAATLVAFAACALDVDDPIDSARDSAAVLTLSDSEVAAILAFVNAAATDVSVLDDDVGLNRRAALSIIAHRSGADGVFGNADDKLFDTLQELDAVLYVGPVAIRAILDFVGGGTTASVIVEGVAFTDAAAAAVVWGVNRASLAELDDDVGLSGRSAASLVDGGPYASILSIAAVSYVGSAALTQLRAYAPIWRSLMDSASGELAGTFDGVAFDEVIAALALDIANVATQAELVGPGAMWATGAARLVSGRPYSNLGDVAAVSGIGTATMQELHDFAASGLWPIEACTPTVVAASVSTVSSYSAAIRSYDPREERSKFSLAAFTAPSCLDLSNPEHLVALRRVVIDHAGWGWVLSEFPQVLEYSAPVAGAGRFLGELDRSSTYMADFRAEYLRQGMNNAAALYSGIAAQYQTVRALATTGSPRSLSIHLEAVECSEDAALVIDSVTGRVIVIHRGPGC